MYRKALVLNERGLGRRSKKEKYGVLQKTQKMGYGTLIEVQGSDRNGRDLARAK